MTEEKRVRAARSNPDEKLARVLRSGKTSLRASVNAKCWDCIGGDADPAPKRRIGTCVVKGCALYSVRPYQRAEKG